MSTSTIRFESIIAPYIREDQERKKRSSRTVFEVAKSARWLLMPVKSEEFQPGSELVVGDESPSGS
jgi:hypothetical protein